MTVSPKGSCGGGTAGRTFTVIRRQFIQMNDGDGENSFLRTTSVFEEMSQRWCLSNSNALKYKV